jgi:peptidoglycan/xylan/chitin deacetylase (PgdA/CDA1 family)
MLSARQAAKQVVKTSAAALDVLHRPRPGVVVLVYHRVGGASGLEIDLPDELFDAQMEALAASGRVVSLAAALEGLAAPDAPMGLAPVVLTFDDGTADLVDRALPILVRHRLPITLYAATEFIEERRSFPDDGRPVTWSGLADACSTGLVEVGSHTHRHRLLDRVSAQEASDELDRSIELIGEHLGRPPLDFAYPKAVQGSAAADRAVRGRFRSAALAGTRPNPYGATDPYALARSPVQRSDGLRWFERKADGGMALEDQLRGRLNRFRYADATT